MKRLLLLGTALVLLLTACGGSHKSVAPPTIKIVSVPVHSVHSLALLRRREAGRKAERLLRRVVLPPGATRLRRPPAHSSEVLLRSGLGVSVSTKFADRHAFWSVRMPLSAVDSFVKAHPTAGLKWGSGGSDGAPGPPNMEEDFYGRPVGGRPLQRLLGVAMVRIHGRTVIRVDAGAAWVYPRSSLEVVPSGVRELDISGTGVSRRVTDRAKVARIVRWFDALNVVQPGNQDVRCAFVLAAKVKFVFGSAGRDELASAMVPSQPADGCNPIQFSIHGKRQTPLIDATPGKGKAFVDRVQRLLRVSFNPRS
jgi:hypothetical protein